MRVREWTSPNGVTHTLVNDKCITCGRLHPDPRTEEMPDNIDWLYCKNIGQHEFGSEPHYCETRQVARYSEGTRAIIDSIPLSLWYAEAREMAYAGRLVEAVHMRDSINELGASSPYARRATIKRGPEVKPPVNPSAISPTRCQCKYHMQIGMPNPLMGPMVGGGKF